MGRDKGLRQQKCYQGAHNRSPGNQPKAVQQNSSYLLQADLCLICHVLHLHSQLLFTSFVKLSILRKIAFLLSFFAIYFDITKIVTRYT